MSHAILSEPYPLPRQAVADAVTKWMRAEPLTTMEKQVVDYVMAMNQAALQARLADVMWSDPLFLNPVTGRFA